MKIRKSSLITAAVCTAALSAAVFISGHAAEDSAYKSQGKIVFDNNTQDPVDDVIFDASDFFVIDGMVRDGKNSIKDALLEYDHVNIDEGIPAFDTLAAEISGLADGTDADAGNILSGKNALVGKRIITGAMPDYGSINTAAIRIAEREENAEITIPEGYYNEESRITVPIGDIKDMPTLDNTIIIEAVNNRGGSLDNDATNTEIANAINSLDLTVLGTVEYEYHHHDGGCYGACGCKSYHPVRRNDGSDVDPWYNTWHCDRCNIQVYDESDHEFNTPLENILSRPCGNTVLKCGYQEGQIVSATIKY